MKIYKNLRIVLLVLIFFTGWISCNSKAEHTSIVEKINVKTADVKIEAHSKPIHRSGLLRSTREMRLAFKIGGIVDKIYAEEGQSVKKDQLLAKLNLSEIQAQVSQARSAFNKAQRDLNRVQNLFADSVVTLEQVQNAKTAFNVASANKQIAEFNLRHANIFAPENGKILKRFVEENELVAPGTPVYYFGLSGNEWIVRLGVSDKEILNLQIGDSAAVYFNAYPGISFPAYVSELAESADPKSSTFEVEIYISKAKKPLKSGFVGKLDIFPAKKQNVYLIPIEALLEADGGYSGRPAGRAGGRHAHYGAAHSVVEA